VIEMSRGKLRHEYPKHTVNDEIGTICTELRQSNEALRSYVSDISDNLSRMAQGDFQIQFNADYVGDFSPIKISLEKISSAMIALIRGISAASGRVNESAGSVSGSSSLLASGAQEQSATVDALSETLDLLIRQIAANAGLDGSVVLENVKKAAKGTGFDAYKEEYVDMIAAGIVDPAKVTRSALENAASVAAMVLTTESLVADKPEPPAPPAPGGDMGMGGMY